MATQQTTLSQAPTIKPIPTWKSHYLISTMHWYPWVWNIRMNEDGVMRVDGVGPELLKILSKVMNFTYEYYDTRTFNFGVFNPENGSWTGVGGLIQNKITDIQFTWIPGEDRQTRIALSREVTVCDTRILASVGKAEDSSFLGFLSTFDVEIWYYLLGLIVLSIFLMAASDSIYEYKDFVWPYIKKNLDFYTWMFIASIFCEGSFRTPRSGRNQIMLGIWLMCILTIMNSFCGQFKAMLMSDREEPRIHNIKDLADRPHLIPFIVLETVYQLVLMDSPIEERQIVYKNAQRFGKEAMIHAKELHQHKTYQKVKSGKYVALTDFMASKSYLQNTCEKLVGNRRLYFAEEEVLPYKLNFAIRDDVPKEWMKALDLRIQWMTEGYIIAKLEDNYTWNYGKCVVFSSNAEGGIKMKNLLPIFYLLFVVDAIAFIVCLIEIAVYKSKKRQRAILEIAEVW